MTISVANQFCGARVPVCLILPAVPRSIDVGLINSLYTHDYQLSTPASNMTEALKLDDLQLIKTFKELILITSSTNPASTMPEALNSTGSPIAPSRLVQFPILARNSKC